ncbi:type I-E CRISPR-associated protein Cas5/CasD [Streptomyces sp. RFCAC02]|uniref:type I-E CRISPR-associated protein Cas5/CasD n=1 Tax=Streptomyces sp. RFCAC02 TaxID=2499143 RepID=UPI001020EEA6|nr:type I-E CRISPR-associated protein Cas5/CasD [Streptomyces sp. RFCAC02]
MSGFLLHLSGPMQAWGEHSAFNDRDTTAHPTRSGLIGMAASALGIARKDAVTDPDDGSMTPFSRLTQLRFTVRHDRGGTRMRDFHTVGGGYPTHRTVPTAKGGRRGAGQGTIVSHRHYLADAAFMVAVTSPADPQVAAECAHALATPHWPLHLGRRSCPPGALFVLDDVTDPVAELLRVPLAREQAVHTGVERVRSGQSGDSTVTVRFTADTPFPAGFPEAVSSRTSVTTLNDEPVRLTARDRVHRSRPSYTTSCRLPGQLCGGYGLDYLDAIRAYLRPSPSSERNDT